MTVQDKAAYWHIRLSDARMSDGEWAAFESWMADDPAHVRAIETALRVDHLLDRASEDADIIALRAEALQAMQVGSHRSRFDIRWLGALAAMLLAIVVTTLSMRPAPVDHYSTGTGERRILMLADGSRLSMDAATQVDVAFDDDRRVLTLHQGRAKIDVAKNPLRPFSVSMVNRTVVAVGTSFTVELLQKAERVALHEGKVDIIATPARFPAGEYHIATSGYTLEPGYELVMPIGGHSGRLAKIDVDALSWEAGRLTFVNEPLPAAVERMNRYARDKIALGEGDFSPYRVNGVFNSGDMAAFVEGVTAVLPLAARQEKGRTLLIPRPR